MSDLWSVSKPDKYILTGGIAVDNIMFKNCDQPIPVDTCDTTQNLWCQNKACIPKTFLCDLSDDCGDNSDESVAQCANYKQYNWEGVDSTTFFLQGQSYY